MMNKRIRIFIAITPFVFILLNILLKIIYLTSNSIAGDEPFSIYHSQMGIPSLLHHLSLGNNPPLYEILLHYWVKIAGISALAVRLPSLLFSVATVFVVYKTAKDNYNFKTAVLAGLLLTFSSYQMYFSHEARVYSLLALLTSLSMFFFLKISTFRKGFRIYFILLVINVLLVYSHYFGILLVLFQVLMFYAVLKPDRKESGKFLLYLFLLLILFFPILRVMMLRFGETLSRGTWLQPTENLGNFFDIIYLFLNNNIFWYILMVTLASLAGIKYFYSNLPFPLIRYFVIGCLIPLMYLISLSIYLPMPFFWHLTASTGVVFLFLLVIMILTVVFLMRKETGGLAKTDKIVLSWFLLPFILLFLVSYKEMLYPIPVFHDRYLIFLSIGFYLSLARMFSHLLSRFRFRYAVYLAIILLLICTCDLDPDNKRHVKEVVSRIEKLKGENTTLLICPAHFSLNFTYYYDPVLFREADEKEVYGKILRGLSGEKIFFINDTTDIGLINSEKLIFLDAGSEYPSMDHSIVKRLQKEFHLLGVEKMDEVHRLYRFRKN